MDKLQLQSQLITRALEIHDSMPPFYSVTTDWHGNQPLSDRINVPNGPGEAAYAALEEVGEQLSVKCVSALRSALEHELARRGRQR